ncbi:hypothetical protein BC941DRAFT_474823 [Chlamydoabsidia padenii]|nr:hypothetical protein BC941DRAFT_474823 [Chlamydoabsidia padenii]
MVHAQSDNMETSSFTDVSNSPKIGLQLGTWSILDLNETQRGAVCDEQIQFCKNDCGDTSINFCDSKTMQWGCNCQQKLPKSLPFQWPVTVAECSGKEKTCESGCADQNCRDLCQNYFKCNRPGSEPSKLRMTTVQSSRAERLLPATGWFLFFLFLFFSHVI